MSEALSEFTVAELRNLCRKFGISGTGLKMDIIQRICDQFEGEEGDDEDIASTREQESTESESSTVNNSIRNVV